VSVDYSRKRRIVSLTLDGLHDEITVSREYDSPQFACTINQVSVIDFSGSVLLSGENIDAGTAQGPRYRNGHMDIHVERKAQRGRSPPSFN